MKKNEFFLAVVVLCFVLGLFFHKVFLNGYIPFPGDLLISSYSPWNYYSYLGYNPASYPTKFQYFDVIRQLYPWKIFVIESLKNGQMPFWNPYNFSGVPLLANLQSQVFSPFNLLYFILPNIYAWSSSLIFQIILAFLFTYMYTRKMGLGREGSIFSSVAFSCCLYMSVFFQYGVFGQTILFLPLVLLGIEKILNKISVRGIIALMLGVIFSAFAGHLQIFSYQIAFSIVYTIFRLFEIKKFRLTKILIISVSYLFALGVSMIQFLPALELIGHSARAAHSKEFFFSTLLLKLNQLILFLAPDFYGNPTTSNFVLPNSYAQMAFYIGIFPLIFAISSLFLKKTKWMKFYIAAIIVIIIGITLNPISPFFYQIPIPFLSSSSPTNSIFLISFSLCILAGFGLDQWTLKKNKYPIALTGILLIILVTAFLIHRYFSIEFNFSNTLYSSCLIIAAFIILLAQKFTKKMKILAGIIVIITILDLFYFFQKYNPFVPTELVFPNAGILNIIQKKAGIDRVWGYGYANIQANMNLMYGFSSPEGYDPLYPKNYGELIYMSKSGRFPVQFDERTRSDAVIKSTLGALDDKRQLKLLNLLGVKYILDREENGSTEKIFPPDTFKPVYDHDGWKIFENKKASPRVFLTGDYRIYHKDSEFQSIFYSDTFNPAKTILLEKEISFSANSDSSKEAKISIKEYKPNKIVFETATEVDKLLFLSDTYYPGWKAYIDGNEAEILKANYAFRALEVPKGQHEVKFIYDSLSFSSGLKMCIISLLMTVVFISAIKLRKNKYAE